ncbi:metabotropic glutamate receptor 1-like [Saccoglossus kowalevskii]|uniref:Metabotropic glutamate receptor 1-like n=1 Tax=Saccoglossus kowalevskii TaxID=10224 RepID=A0ABM0GXW2_SACKO|nr:PREDICTED: metabotropic glutamate receptor 1-like [Saccoglossus kowalevskii]
MNRNIWFTCFAIHALVYGNHVPRLTDTKFYKDGDIILGGLLNLHIFDSNRECVNLDAVSVLHRVEAMVYTIEEINSRQDILPGVTIGYEIYDSCVSEDVALSATFALLENITKSDLCDGTAGVGHKLKGVVGPRRSSVSAAISRVFGLYHMPQITYMASSDELSDKSAFPFYLRAVPPDRLQVSTMMDVIRHFNWTYISLVNSDGSYGKYGANEIKRQAALLDICIATAEEVSRFANDAQIDVIVNNLLDHREASVVVIFSVVYMANRVFEGVKRANATDKFIWIGSDGVYDLVANGNGGVGHGGFFIEQFNTRSDGYESYFKTIALESSENPWLGEYWTHYNMGESQEDGFSANMGISAVIDAVYTYGFSLESMRYHLCGNGVGVCEDFLKADGRALLPYLRNSSFYGTRGLVQFDENGDLLGKYVVKNLQLINGRYERVTVGFWDSLADEEKLSMDNGAVTWGVETNPKAETPKSVCSEPCPKGHIVIPHGDVCCWDCFQCRDNEIPANNYTECRPCELLNWPDIDFMRCEPILPTYLEWNEPIAVSLISVSLIGLAISVITTFGYVIYRNKPLIKASSRELSYIMLAGVTFSYIMVFVFVAKPTLPTCVLVRLGLMLCFTVTYAPMLTKVVRIYRIFKSSSKSTKRLTMIGPTSQVIITSTIIVIQLCINVIWAIVIPPNAVLEMPIETKKRVELSCNVSAAEIGASVAWNILLIVLCCWFAFKTRKVPDNYNESRFIALSVYTTLVIWMAFIPTYITVQDSTFKVSVLSCAILLNAYVTIVCLYVPKLYAVHYVNDENVRIRFAVQVDVSNST